jgi:NAD+--asparagine ADP-ribosyltransferase
MRMNRNARKLIAEELKQLAERRRNEAQRVRERFKRQLIDFGTGTAEEVEARLAGIDFRKFCSDPGNAEVEIKQMFDALYPHMKEGV